MQRLKTFITLLLVGVMCSAQSTIQSATGILLVHYGTNNDQSRAVTLDRLNSKVATRFSDCKVVEAYAAPSVIKSLAQRGIKKLTIPAAIDSLRRLGCSRMVVQSTMLLDGIMTDIINDNIKRVRNDFQSISQCRPLLYTIDDCRSLLNIIERHLYADRDLDALHSQIVLVGHGSASAANAMYCQLDYLLKDEGKTTWHVGTIEGYPSIDSVKRQLAKSRTRRVALVPLLYIAGNHQREDIEGEWKESLARAGYVVNVVNEGLGEMQEVQEMIMERIHKQINEKNEQ